MPSTPDRPESWNNPAVIDTLARRHYQDELEFHNYPHSLMVNDVATGIADTAIAHGTYVERLVIKPASGYHDVGADLRFLIADSPIFATTEEYASDIARRDLRMLSMPEPLVLLTSDVIESTNPNVECATDTAKCLRQADLIAGGVMDDDDIVLLNGTYRLYKEEKRLKEEPAASLSDPDALIGDLLKFGEISYEILSALVEDDLSLGDHERDADGNSLFNERARRSISRLLPENLRRILNAKLYEIVSYQPATA